MGGFIGAHLVHVLFYHPELLQEDPWVLFKFWGGLSSIGGFLGGMSAAVGYLLYKKQPLLPYGDRLLSALVVGWIFGRTGCSFAHDHPGRLTDFFLGIPIPRRRAARSGFLRIAADNCNRRGFCLSSTARRATVERKWP